MIKVFSVIVIHIKKYKYIARNASKEHFEQNQISAERSAYCITQNETHV